MIRVFAVLGLDDGYVEIALCDFGRRTERSAVAPAQATIEAAANASRNLSPQLSDGHVLVSGPRQQRGVVMKPRRLDVLHAHCLADLLRTACRFQSRRSDGSRYPWRVTAAGLRTGSLGGASS